MQIIHAEGTEFELATGSDYLGESDLGIELPIPPEEIARSTDSRVALFRGHLPPNKWIAYVIIWQDDTDLKDLELRIEKGVYTDGDFANAFRTRFKKLRCPSCHSEVGAFVIDPGDPYPLNDILHREKVDKLAIKTCPSCLSQLRQLVVKVI